MAPIVRTVGAFLERNVRKGFLLAVLVSSSIAGSSLYATIAMMPYFQIRSPQTLLPSALPVYSARSGVPAELAWFFVQYHYVSAGAHIRSKNRHTFVVSDGPRHREYVVTLGQSFRRVEIYYGDAPGHSTVHLYTPSRKRIVEFEGTGVASNEVHNEPNLWMWQGPLWNSEHIKIYALADFWLDTPYKKFSCAGFVHQFLQDAGVHVPILDAWDMAKLPWMSVPADELEPGDIITIRAGSEQHRRFWNHRITHVGVYLGNGKLIHASTPSYRSKRSYVRVATLDQFRGRIDKIIRPPDLL